MSNKQFRNADKLALPAGDVGDLIAGSLAFRNKLMNARFTVNQRGYASGAATTGSNQYTLDRWRVVTSGQNLSWSTSGGVVTITAPAGGVEQVIEGNNLITGTHVLNWTGTATATVGGVSVAKGGTFSVTGGSDLTVRFSGGTVVNPQLEIGTVPTTFEARPYGIELMLCQRYFISYTAAVSSTTYCRFGLGSCTTSTIVAQVLQLPVQLRTRPTLTTSSVAADFAVYAQNTITACNDIPALELASTGLVLNILWSVASGLTAGNVAVLMANNNNTAHIHLSAEL